MITDREIQAKLKQCSKEHPRLELAEKSERGGGRLLLLIRWLESCKSGPVGEARVGRRVSEWYARYYRNKKRRLTKIGTYPTMSLAAARKLFREEYAPTILSGAKPTNPYSRLQHRGSDLSVRGLFTSYVEELKRQGKMSWYEAERILLKRDDNAADALGADRAAGSIEPSTIVAYLSELHSRGVIGMAHTARSYVRAAYSFGLKSEHSYTKEGGDGRWGLKSNPVAAIPIDVKALRVGQRFLEPREFRAFWEYLLDNHSRWFAGLSLLLIMATGQRVQEILKLRIGDYDKDSGLLYWSKTKNGRPHSIPVPAIAAEILEQITPSSSGWFFPHRFKPDRHAISTTPNKICEIYAAETGAKRFTPRDLRRTWKTLAGRAGISKEMRDRLQNHLIDNNVSSRHYDRYDYLPERRAAMKRWNKFLERILVGDLDGELQDMVKTKVA